MSTSLALFKTDKFTNIPALGNKWVKGSVLVWFVVLASSRYCPVHLGVKKKKSSHVGLCMK